MDTSKLVDFLDQELNTAGFEDSSHNGLQVANSGTVRRVCCGVDASMEFFAAAKEAAADFLICHHGISWGDSLKQITGLNYERLAFLIENDMALYASHLPLDAHPRYGNNARIAKALGLTRIKPFGNYRGQVIGFEGRLPSRVRYQTLKERVRSVVNERLQSMDFGKKTVQRIAIVSGGASDLVAAAADAGADCYVSGEPSLAAYSQAQEYRINVIFAGHYATETFGVKAVGELINKRFRVPAEFINLGVPY